MVEFNLMLGNCLDRLKDLEDNSIDSIVTDPPYGLSFMGKKWDYDVPSVAIWKECLRVLKPGAMLLSFAGSRTYHRMACNIEDAGFEIRDQIMWIYGSGFPKSHNISKSLDKYGKLKYFDSFRNKLKEVRDYNNIKNSEIDKHFNFNMSGHWFGNSQPTVPTKIQYNELKNWWNIKEDDIKELDKVFEEAEREVIGKQKTNLTVMQKIGETNTSGKVNITAPATEEAKQWEGWGTALKPAHEPIVVARKPLGEKTVALNVLKWGTGGINIDGCRVKTDDNLGRKPSECIDSKNKGTNFNTCEKTGSIDNSWELGRFPANIILDEEAGKILDEQSGIGTSGKQGIRTSDGFNDNIYGKGMGIKQGQANGEYGDKGGASRFFYCPKASKKDRNEGCEELEEQTMSSRGSDGKRDKNAIINNSNVTNKNNHPTVKPTKLMQYLVRLVTPKGAVCLDPFMGSGSTGKACMKENVNFLGIEMNEEYMEIAKKRINGVLKTKKRNI